VADASVDLDELVDLKMLPAWVSEPPPGQRYAEHGGEDRQERRGRDRREGRGPQRKRPTPNFQRPTSKPEGPRREFDRPSSKAKRPEQPGQRDRRPPRPHDHRHREDRHHRPNRPPAPEKPLPPLAVRFLPRAAAFESVVEQIKSGTVAYSLFALARLFLEKAPRHDVKLTPPADVSLFQLGENGAISVDRHFLERNAFRFAQDDFYKVEVTETDPIKGNFTNVARDRLSGTLLGPTNHHDYQRRLRNLYEQRFSRRMSFGDFQRQIQIVTDPAEIEKWKEEARKVTTYSTSREEPPQTFASAGEAERHFEKNYLPELLRRVSEVTIDGPVSRRMHDRVLNRVIENEWNRETKSPSPMMQELAARFREVGLHIFRHRRGMLFVSPVYPRQFRHDETGVSPQVRTILEAITAQPRIGRKELADKLIDASSPDSAAYRPARPPHSAPAGDETDRAKLALASDLLWLVNAGYVIEFNDGSLDLPRAKTKQKETSDSAEPEQEAVEAAVPANEETIAEMSAAEKEQRVEAGAPPADELIETANETKEVVAAVVSTAEPDKQASAAADASTTQEEPSEVSGS
jgi:hypothetical protein